MKGKSREDFAKDPMLRSAVERQYEIIGEAIAGLARVDPGCAERIPEHRRIVAFRNILIHGTVRVERVDDAELLALLASAQRPTGLIRTPLGVTLTASVTDSLGDE